MNHTQSASSSVQTALLSRLFQHNTWATRRILESCRVLNSDQFHQRFEMGVGSLHDTLVHIVGAMMRWAQRIGGVDVSPSVEQPGSTFTIEEIIQLLGDADRELALAVHQVACEGRLDEMMEFKAVGIDSKFRFTRGTAVVHVITHGAHHRAQALNMLRQLKVDSLPEIDAIEWELAESN